MRTSSEGRLHHVSETVGLLCDTWSSSLTRQYTTASVMTVMYVPAALDSGSLPMLTYQGFFSIYRNLFMRLAHDEFQWTANAVNECPVFGDSSWPWAPTVKEDASRSARTFYTFWMNFATEKDFSWCDQWEINEAPDRRVRR